MVDEGVWAYNGVASIVGQHAEERQTPEADNDWLKQTVKRVKTGLQQFHLQAKLLDAKMTPNAALLKFEGSAHLTVEQVAKTTIRVFNDAWA